MEVDAPLLAPIVELAGLLFAFAFIVVARRVIQAFLGTLASWLSFLPGIGSVTAGLVNSAESAISGALSSAIRGIESAIGHSWHLLSRTLGMLWAEQKLVAENLWHLAGLFYHAVPLSDFTKLIHRLDARVSHITQQVTKDITKAVHTTVVQVEHLGHTIPRELHRLEHAIDTTIPREIGSLWGRTKALERSISQLWDSVRSLPTSDYVAGAIAAAIAAIDLFQLNPFRCSEASNLFRRGCSGVWGGLENLLGMLVDLFVITNLCDVIPALETAFSDVAAPAIGELTSAIDSMPCVAGNQPPALAVPALALPPTPDLTLSLP